MKLNIALAVVIKERQVLIQKRFRSQLGMVYDFPGGKVDEDECIEDGAKRELLKETADHHSYDKMTTEVA